jgi:hypothetical protein
MSLRGRSQGFIESWFGKQWLVWCSKVEPLYQARKDIAGYVDANKHRLDSRLRYRTVSEVHQTWEVVKHWRTAA